MPFKGKPGKGKKGRSGRKTTTEEIKAALGFAKERITQEALIELANNKVFELLQTCRTIEEVRGLGLPITLKGITEKKELSGNVSVETITGMKIIKENGDNVQN